MRRLVLLLLAAGTFPALASTPDWLRQAAQVPTPKVDAETRAVVLFDEQITTVKDSGETFSIHRHAVRVLRPQGRQDATIAIPFDAETRITFLKGWSIGTQGHETELKEKDAVETALFSESFYDDTRHKVMAIPAEVGTVFGYEYEQKERPMVFQDAWLFQKELPVVKSRFELRLPSGWEYESYWSNHEAQAPQKTGPTSWAWMLEDIPAVESEEEMPAWRAVAGRMILNYFGADPNLRDKTHNSWVQVGDWAAGMFAGQAEPTAEIKARAAALTASAASPVEKMRALAAYVQRNIRYVAIEIGIGGYRPHAAADIYRNQYGDCKDKATLMAAMLRSIGIESRYVMVHSERGVVTPAIPSALTFNHAILAIQLPAGDRVGLDAVMQQPGLGTLLFFDPTDEFTPFGQLSAALQASYALVVAPKASVLLRLPMLGPDANRLDRQATLELAPDGTLQGNVKETRSGEFSSAMRARLLGTKVSDRPKVLENLLAPYLGHFRFLGATIENLERFDQPLEIRYRFAAPNYAKFAGNLLLIRPRVLGEKSDDVLEKKVRHYPIELNRTRNETDTFEIKLPEGYTIDELPGPTAARYEFAEYTSETTSTEGTLHYSRRYRVKQLQIDPPQFDQLKLLYRQIAADERGSAVLKRQP